MILKSATGVLLLSGFLLAGQSLFAQNGAAQGAQPAAGSGGAQGLPELPG